MRMALQDLLQIIVRVTSLSDKASVFMVTWKPINGQNNTLVTMIEFD